MSWFQQILFRLRSLFRKKRLDADMAEEMRLHLELRTQRNIAAGMGPDEARFAAMRVFGGVEQIREQARDGRSWTWVEEGLQDLRYGMRTLRAAPGFTAVVVVSLALGIGVNTTTYTIVRDHYLRPLVRDARLNLVSVFTARDGPIRDFRAFSHSEYSLLRDSREVFSEVAAMSWAHAAVGETGRTRRSLVCLVSDGYFSLLNVRPLQGRFFSATETAPNSSVPVVVVSHGFWRRLGYPADLVGRSLPINGLAYSIIGIAPEGFGGLHNAITPEVWLPLGVASQISRSLWGTAQSPDLLHPRTFRLFLIGALRTDLTLAAARSRLALVEERLNSIPASDPSARRKLFITRPSRYNLGTTRPDDAFIEDFVNRSSALATGLAGIVLLVACLNTANLLLARGSVRQKELAIRVSIGASRSRIVRQLLTEGMLLGLLSGALALALTWGSGNLLSRWWGEMFSGGKFAFNGRPAIDWSVFVVAGLASVLATLAFSLVPALRSTRFDLSSDLKRQGGRHGSGAGNRFFSLGHCLAMGQIGLSVILLFAAGLFLRAAVEAKGLDFGFATEGRLVANIDYGLGNTATEDVPRRQRALLARGRELPGVIHAALGSTVPYNFETDGRRVFNIGDRVDSQTVAGHSAVQTAVSRDYFPTMGIPLLRGRDFNELETSPERSRSVAIIDDTLARALFGHEDAIGRHLAMNRPDPSGRSAQTEIEIVGIVRSPREEVFQRDPPKRIYRPLGQVPSSNTYVHVQFDPRLPIAATADRLRRDLQSVERDNPILQVQPLADFPRKNINFAAVRFGAVAVGVCGGIAFLLALVGVYGVKAHSVARRTRELGIRIALGALSSDVLRLVLVQGILQTAVAVAIGSILALTAGQALSKILYRIEPNDWLLLALAGGTLFVAAIFACFVPARRATRVNPIVALRSE